MTEYHLLSRIAPLLRQQKQFVTLAIALVGCSFPSIAAAQEQMLRVLTVSGQGVEKIATTLTNVQLGVEIQGKTATEVQKEVAQRSEQVVNYLRSQNVTNLQTTGINLQPNYDYTDNQRRLLGYSGTNTVSFQVSIEQAGKIMDESVNQGATRIDYVNFTATEDAIANAQKQALRKATVDAQQQAEAVLSSLNLTSKEIVSISINGANAAPIPMPIVKTMAVNDAASSPVIGGEQSVNAIVTLQIKY